ncbi:DUF493 family protein [Pseudodesulfovibrio cashew]|uniref:DUF493 family protein n=1 Tax=Pseudodesulfovibrio cashew TaxID=2678688 RepID=A0A6I6JJM2_9BACT|nr:DUF493 family protein [Pseudodesulfovibrio cashew]QGY41339.1 DUF493 family protein [Pseudodesulfovibrio cashew]
MPHKNARFKQALDGHHQWPCPYVFKFIVPNESLEALLALFPGEEVTTRPSKSGKYISATLESHMCSSKAVMDVYEKVSVIPGIMAL